MQVIQDEMEIYEKIVWYVDLGTFERWDESRVFDPKMYVSEASNDFKI